MCVGPEPLCQLFSLVIPWLGAVLTVDDITSLGRGKPKLKVWFLPDACCFHTSVSWGLAVLVVCRKP